MKEKSTNLGLRRTACVDSRPKTLFVAPSFGASGGETHALECIARWHTFDIFSEIRVLTTKKGVEVLRRRGLEKIRAHAMPLIPKNQHHFFSSGLLTSFLVKTFLCFVVLLGLLRQKAKPNIVFTVSHFIHDLLPATVFAKLTKAKLIVYIHHLHPSLSERTRYHPLHLSLLAWINDLISLQLIKLFADKVIGLSLQVKNQCKELGIQEGKIAVTMNGINLECITRIRNQERLYDACFLGRIYPLKGIFDLVNIWKVVCSKLPDAKLVVIGEGARKYEDMLKDRIKSNELLRNIILKGYLPENEKYASLKSCRVFVFPSYEEGWGITICEAMACKLPVVAYNLPAYTVFGDAIVRVPIGNKQSFAEELLKVLENEKLQARMGEDAYVVANQFDWDKVAIKELRLIESLIQAKDES